MWSVFIAGIGSESDRVFFAGCGAFHTEDTFRSVYSFPAGVHNIHIHGTNAAARSAGDTFAFVHLDTEQRVVACGFQKHRYGAKVFTERPVIPEGKGQRNS